MHQLHCVLRICVRSELHLVQSDMERLHKVERNLRCNVVRHDDLTLPEIYLYKKKRNINGD